MADQAPNKGFNLPVPVESGDAANKAAPATSGGFSLFPTTVPGLDAGPEPRDYAIGGGVLIVLLIAFFFAKGAYANHLVRKRVAPSSSNAAGWWLFIFLSGLAIASVLAILSPVKFLTPFVMVPIGLVCLFALVFTFVTGRNK